MEELQTTSLTNNSTVGTFTDKSVDLVNREMAAFLAVQNVRQDLVEHEVAHTCTSVAEECVLERRKALEMQTQEADHAFEMMDYGICGAGQP